MQLVTSASCNKNQQCQFPKTQNDSISGILPPLHFLLTKREQECLPLIKKGMSNKIIARRLNISPRTVDSHLESIKRKLECNNKYELINKLIAYDYMG